MTARKTPAWKRAKHRIAHSIKLRMVLVFLLLAAALSFVFFTGAQKAFTMGWREAARPILMDYVDIVVHLFLKETREYYRLENLWAEAPRESFAAEPGASGAGPEESTTAEEE